MARQRDLERAGWQFVRIRGGDFYRDSTKALEPLWAELDRLGIKAGGIDEVAAEPPPPADRRFERSERDELVGIDPEPIIVNDNEPALDLRLTDVAGRQVDLDWVDRVGKNEVPILEQTTSSLLGEYVSYESVAGADPRTVSTGEVADGLVRIIEVEGPMLAKRAYDIYLRGCCIRRLGGELKSTMNKALMSAIRQGRVISENEPGETGLIFSTVRIKDSPPIRPRRRGPRAFEEVPPGELRYVGRRVLEQSHVQWGSDEHLRAILDVFDLKRLTIQVGTTLLEILEGEGKRSDELFPGSTSGLPPKDAIRRSIGRI
jgi:hypothetical protein